MGRMKPEDDSKVITILRSHGALIYGKTRMDELSTGVLNFNEHFGRASHPLNFDYTPGGSSGGSANAVNIGMAEVALVTDTFGGIRIPAALSGLFGFRPTLKRYPTNGVTPVSKRLD